MSILQTGVYANSNTPLWLSALTPIPGPNNLQVSTLTVNATGGVIMVSDNDPYPATGGAPVAFNRITGQPATQLRQTPSKQVPTKAVEGTYLASVTQDGIVYDDIALQGLQIYGPQLTLPSANTGCAGYLTQGPDPFSVKLYTGRFYNGNLAADVATFSTLAVSSFTFPGSITFSTVNASTINSGNVTASTLTVSSFSLPNVIQVSTINALQGIFSSITAPNIGGGSISTFSTLTASTLNANTANISTLNVSSFTLPTSVQFSTLAASTLNANTANISTLNVSSLTANAANISTFSVSSLTGTDANISSFRGNYAKISSIYGVDNNSFISTGYFIGANANINVISTGFIQATDISTMFIQANYALLSSISTTNISTTAIIANNISTNSLTVSSISTNTITANVASFSTLNAPAGSVNVSTINTGLVSTTVGVVRELFLSTMTFNATLSPSLDLGLGGVIGGLVGGFGANALSVGLGAAGLATGIGALAMSRTSGGTDPSFYQTVNGTSQIQFSTFTSPITRVFVNTDSATPRNTPGNIVNTTTTIPAGTLVMRSVSDPLNLPNASGFAGQGIQGFSQWTQVIPGQTQIGNNRVSSINGNYIDFGSNLPGVNFPNDYMYFNVPPGSSGGQGIFNFNSGILGTSISLGPTLGSGGDGFVNGERGYFIQNLTSASNLFSTIQAAYQPSGGNIVYTSSLGIYPAVTTSSINLSSIVSANPAQLISVVPGIVCSTILVSTLTFGASVVDTLTVNNTLNVGSNTTSASISTINLRVSNFLKVIGSAAVDFDMTVTRDLNVTRDLTVTRNLFVTNSIQAANISTFNINATGAIRTPQTVSTATLRADTSFTTFTSTFRLAVEENATVANTLKVGGVSGSTPFGGVNSIGGYFSTLTAPALTVSSINNAVYPPPSGLAQPTGSLMMWPGGGLSAPTNVPSGYLYCDGTSYAIASYPALYAAIGDTWGGTAGIDFKVPDTRGRLAFGALSQAGSDDVVVSFQSLNVTGPGINAGDRQNGWYVTGASGVVRPGMIFDFQTGGIIGTVRKILGTTDGSGDGWNLPFVILWAATATAPPTVFPTYAVGSVQTIIQVASTTIGPWCGATTANAGIVTPRASLGSAAIIQGSDQVGAHTHGYGQGGVQAAAGSAWRAGDPNTGGPVTSVNSGMYGYTVASVNYVVNAAMPYIPPNFAIFYFIKT